MLHFLFSSFRMCMPCSTSQSGTPSRQDFPKPSGRGRRHPGLYDIAQRTDHQRRRRRRPAGHYHNAAGTPGPRFWTCPIYTGPAGGTRRRRWCRHGCSSRPARVVGRRPRVVEMVVAGRARHSLSTLPRPPPPPPPGAGQTRRCSPPATEALLPCTPWSARPRTRTVNRPGRACTSATSSAPCPRP